MNYERGDQRVPLRRFAGSDVLFFRSKMSCDVDGSPNAYHPLDDNLSLDVIGSAGGRRRDGLASGPLDVLPSPEVVVYVGGKPFIQPDGEFKGFYVSETSYQNPALPATDPTRYLDARRTRYVVLPGGMVSEATVGDLIVVVDPHFLRHIGAVFGDIGPTPESGEASLATLQGLGLPATDGKSSPGQWRDDLLYIVFPKTAGTLAAADPWPHSQATIDRLAEAEFQRWGGMERAEEIIKGDTDVGSVPDSGEMRAVYEDLASVVKSSLLEPAAFDLPERVGGKPGGRLPCASELVVAAHDAALAIQRRIGAVERSAAGPETLGGLGELLRGISEIFRRFPAQSGSIVDGELREQTRIDALLKRLADVQTARRG